MWFLAELLVFEVGQFYSGHQHSLLWNELCTFALHALMMEIMWCHMMFLWLLVLDVDLFLYFDLRCIHFLWEFMNPGKDVYLPNLVIPVVISSNRGLSLCVNWISTSNCVNWNWWVISFLLKHAKIWFSLFLCSIFVIVGYRKNSIYDAKHFYGYFLVQVYNTLKGRLLPWVLVYRKCARQQNAVKSCQLNIVGSIVTDVD